MKLKNCVHIPHKWCRKRKWKKIVQIYNLCVFLYGFKIASKRLKINIIFKKLFFSSGLLCTEIIFKKERNIQFYWFFFSPYIAFFFVYFYNLRLEIMLMLCRWYSCLEEKKMFLFPNLRSADDNNITTVCQTQKT